MQLRIVDSIGRLLFCVEIDQAAHGSAAGRTEGRSCVGAHAAVIGRTIYSMKRVPPSFIKSYRPFRRFRYRCGLRRSFGNQIFPLAFKIHKCGDVRFPRLHICGIGLVIWPRSRRNIHRPDRRNYGRIHEQPQAGNSHVAMWSAYSCYICLRRHTPECLPEL